MEFSRLQRSIHFKASHLCCLYGRPGHSDVQIVTCPTCQLLEINWNLHPVNFFICSKCSDLAKQFAYRDAFLKLFANALPFSPLLPYIFEYLYPETIIRYHSRIQQIRTLKLSLLGFSGSSNSLFALHIRLLKQEEEQENLAYLQRGNTLQLRRLLTCRVDLLSRVCSYLI